MGTAVTIPAMKESSQLPHARLAGALYLLTTIFGVSAEMLHGKLVLSTNAAATATNVLAHPDLLRLSVAANLLGDACYVAVTALFYYLFKPVNRRISLVAAFFSLIGCAMGAVSCALDLVPSTLLSAPPFTTIFSVEQSQGLALLFFRAGGQAYRTGMVFFGFYCVLIGYLAFRSRFMPRVIGLLMALAGVAWLTFLWPPLAMSLASVLMLTGLIGEGSIMLWLLLMGVNLKRWQEQAVGFKSQP